MLENNHSYISDANSETPWGNNFWRRTLKFLSNWTQILFPTDTWCLLVKLMQYSGLPNRPLVFKWFEYSCTSLTRSAGFTLRLTSWCHFWPKVNFALTTFIWADVLWQREVSDFKCVPVLLTCVVYSTPACHMSLKCTCFYSSGTCNPRCLPGLACR